LFFVSFFNEYDGLIIFSYAIRLNAVAGNRRQSDVRHWYLAKKVELSGHDEWETPLIVADVDTVNELVQRKFV